MKKSEFKKIVKQMMIECFQDEDVQTALKESMRGSTQEVVLQSGLLSSVISEVVSGLSPMINESKRQESFYIEEDEPVRPQFYETSVDRAGASNEFEQSFGQDVEKQNNTIYQEMRERQQANKPQLQVGGINVFEGTRATSSKGEGRYAGVRAAGQVSEEQGTIPDEARSFLTKTFSDRWKTHMSRKFERNVITGVIASKKQGNSSRAGLFQNSNQVKKASKALALEEYRG